MHICLFHVFWQILCKDKQCLHTVFYIWSMFWVKPDSTYRLKRVTCWLIILNIICKNKKHCCQCKHDQSCVTFEPSTFDEFNFKSVISVTISISLCAGRGVFRNFGISVVPAHRPKPFLVMVNGVKNLQPSLLMKGLGILISIPRLRYYSSNP